MPLISLFCYFVLIVFLAIPAHGSLITDDMINNRIETCAEKIFINCPSSEIKSAPKDEAAPLETNYETFPWKSIFYLVNDINVDKRYVKSEKIINTSPKGWNKIAIDHRDGKLIGWIKDGCIEDQKNVLEREKTEEEKRNAEKKKRLERAFKEQNDKREKTLKNFKGFSFRGILMGIPLENQMMSCEEERKIRSKVIDVDDDNESPTVSEKRKKIKEPQKAREMKPSDFESREMCYGTEISLSPEETSYSINNLPYLGFHAHTTVYILDNKVERIIAKLSDDGADKMLSLLREKYGKPKAYQTFIVKNRMNSKFKAFSAVWNIKNCELSLFKRLNEINDGYLFIETSKFKKYQKKADREKNKKALDRI